jgi:hypothetical protein
MPSIDLSILNQRQTPAFYADTLANRPAAGFVGRIFVSTDTFAFFRDNGTGWDLIGGPGTGTVTGSGANGQVSFWNGASSITGSNNLFFDAVNGHLGIGTITPGTALEIDHDQNTIIQLQQTVATNDNRITFINSGVGLWRLGAFYNAGANDFGLFDIAAATQPVTVKRTTGQVLIGTSTVGSGKLVVASATSDNGIQIVGATSPSLRIDSAESGPTKRIGIGLATAVNNFIQNSQNLDMCIFNGSTSAAGNMLFGIYDTSLANIQEAARISSARNFLIGTITDTGEKLQVSGTALITGELTINTSLAINRATASSTYLIDVFNSNATNNAAYSTYRNAGVTMSIGVERSVGGAIINGGAYTGVITTVGTKDLNLATNEIIRLNINGTTGAGTFSNNVTANYGGVFIIPVESPATGNVALIARTSNGANDIFRWFDGATQLGAIKNSGNFLIGTTTDAGQKLQVNGTAYINGNTGIGTNNPTSGLGWSRILDLSGVGSSAYVNRINTSTQESVFGTDGGGCYIDVSGAVSGASNNIVFRTTATNSSFAVSAKFTIKSSGVINIASIPTSPVGLSSGDIWSNSGLLTIVP